MIMDYLKRLGGAATGKVIKIGLDMIPYDFTVSRISVKNVVGSILTYALAEYLDYRMPEVADMLKTGAAVIMADELEKEVKGLAAPSRSPATQAVAPKTVIRTPTSSGGLIIA